MTNKSRLKKTQQHHEKKRSSGAEHLVAEPLKLVTEAAYHVALRLGFRESFVRFLEELQEAIHSIIKQGEKRTKKGTHSASAIHH